MKATNGKGWARPSTSWTRHDKPVTAAEFFLSVHLFFLALTRRSSIRYKFSSYVTQTSEIQIIPFGLPDSGGFSRSKTSARWPTREQPDLTMKPAEIATSRDAGLGLVVSHVPKIKEANLETRVLNNSYPI